MLFVVYMMFLISFNGEQSVESVVNHVGYPLEMLCIIFEIGCVAVNYNHMPIVGFYPFLIAFVETSEVVYTHCLLIVSASTLDLIDEMWHRLTNVDE